MALPVPERYPNTCRVYILGYFAESSNCFDFTTISGHGTVRIQNRLDCLAVHGIVKSTVMI